MMNHKIFLKSAFILMTTFLLTAVAGECTKQMYCAAPKAKKDSKIIDVQTLKDNIAKHPKVEETIVDFTNDFQLTSPPNIRIAKEPQASYFYNKSWSYVDPQGPAHILSLQLPKMSQTEIVGELRIGLNSSPKAYQQCLTLPKQADGQSLKQETINNIHFVSFVVRNKTANKSTWVKSYRTQHNNACYAIELRVNANNATTLNESTHHKELAVRERLEKLIHSIQFQWLKQ